MGQDNCKPQPGDIIEIDRPYYQHWALYMGNGYVIHVTDKGDASILGSMASVQTPWPKVKKELLMKVAGCDKWRVNNKYDRNWSPRPVKEIIQVAEKCIDMEVHYAVNSINCEHFFIRLRYGLAVYVLDKDADGDTAAAVIGAVFAGAVAVAAMVLSKM